MRRGHAGRVDQNQAEIVRALRKVGCAVQSLAAIGGGCPDLMVVRGTRVYLLEVKRGKGTVTVAQSEFYKSWPVVTVRTPEEAIEAVTTRQGGQQS